MDLKDTRARLANGDYIFPPLTVGGKTYSVGRILRFLVGVAIVVHAAIWGPYDDLKVMGVKAGLGILLIDPSLFATALAAWKSRNK